MGWKRNGLVALGVTAALHFAGEKACNAGCDDVAAVVWNGTIGYTNWAANQAIDDQSEGSSTQPENAPEPIQPISEPAPAPQPDVPVPPEPVATSDAGTNNTDQQIGTTVATPSSAPDQPRVIPRDNPVAVAPTPELEDVAEGTRDRVAVATDSNTNNPEDAEGTPEPPVQREIVYTNIRTELNLVNCEEEFSGFMNRQERRACEEENDRRIESARNQGREDIPPTTLE